MKALCLTAALCLLAIWSNAQQNYDASLIPKELLSYSRAVVRYSDVGIEVKDLDNTLYHIKEAVTVLNKNGDDEAEISVSYDKFNTIRGIKGGIYNAAGKLIGKFSEKDFSDASDISSYALFEDSRVKSYKPAIIEYPYTIEYELEMRSKQSLNFPDWRPNPATGVSVEKSTYTFACKPDLEINYKEINVPEKAAMGANKDGYKTYSWHINNLRSVRSEPYSPNAEQYLTLVKIAPKKFKYAGMEGAFNNWADLGKWIYDKLLLNRDAIPAETVQYIKELTAGITDPKLKAKKIYEYMQQKTRYISIQVGIGGYQPFLAGDVDRLNYGDCKALVNYTQALLKTAGIESWYCVVKSGSRKKSFMPDFASMNQGDHVILCAPFKNDTTWMECTSQQIPFGYLGDFTDDRIVLACTPQGGKLLHTPRYAPENNITDRTGTFTIDSKGELKGTMTTTFAGASFEDRDDMMGEPYTEQVKMVRDVYPIANFEVEKLEYKKDKSLKPVTTEYIKLNSREFAAFDSNKFYFKINLANRAYHAPDEVRNRRTDVYINRGYVENDEISFTIPEGYAPDKTLLNKTLSKPFGKYELNMKVDGNKLTYKRRLQINDGTFAKESYQELVDFYQAVADGDSYNMSLVKRN